MLLSNLFSFPKNMLLLLLVVTSLSVAPVNSTDYKNHKESRPKFYRNSTKYTNLSQHVVREDACAPIGGKCRSVHNCCGYSDDEDVACAIDGSGRTCQPCKTQGASCEDDSWICCQGFVCDFDKFDNLVCLRCSQDQDYCYNRPCCEGYKCVEDEVSGDEVCVKTCGNSGESCNPGESDSCCENLVCQTEDNIDFNCGPCSASGSSCIPGESPDRCCTGYKCDPSTSTCKCYILGIDLGLCLPFGL